MFTIILFLADVLAPIFIVRSNKVKFSRLSLQDEEKILSIAKTHWFVMFKIVVIQCLITLISLLILISVVQIKGEMQHSSVYGFVLFLIPDILLLLALRKQIHSWCREFVITDNRVLDKYGILSRSISEFRYEKIESCDVEQGILGRLFGFGSIIVRGVGGSSIIEHYVKEPFEFKQYLINVISNKNESHKSDLAQSTANQNDLIMKLQSYKKLLDDGVITQEDFDKKKQQILSEN